MKRFLFLSFMLMPWPSFGAALQIRAIGAPAAEFARQTEDYFSRVIAKLPPLMRKRMRHLDIQVEFGPSPDHEFGSVRGTDSVLLDPFILRTLATPTLQKLTVREWLARRSRFSGVSIVDVNQKYEPKHRSVPDLLDAVLIHQLAHLYDSLEIPNLDYLSQRRRCIYEAVALPLYTSISEECRKLKDITSTVSTLREYLHAAGWPERGFLNVSSVATNTLNEGSPNSFEYFSPAESFAVNMEYFLLDPEFQCRRPLLFRYLARHFRTFIPFKNVQCQSTNKVLFSDGDFLFGSRVKKRIFDFQALDFSRLYQIHYLYAGGNESPMSFFGHGMFRLVFCAPGRPTVSADCLKDLEYHVAASFAAFIDDLEINPLDGLLGNYPSQLFFYPLDHALSSYNDTELREVFSLPLKLNKKQMRTVFDALLEAHWSYRGRYKFISNNCAIETFSILKSAFLYQPKVFDADVVRPDSLYSLLIDLGIGDGQELKDLISAWNKGLYFKSRQKYYDRTLDVLKRSDLIDASFTLEDFVDQAPENRRSIYEKLATLPADQRPAAYTSALSLESLALRRYSQKILRSRLPDFARRLDEVGSQYGIDKNQVKNLLLRLSSPSVTLSLDQSYGIPKGPVIDERETAVNDAIDPKALAALRKKIIKFAMDSFSADEKAAFAQFRANNKILRREGDPN